MNLIASLLILVFSDSDTMAFNLGMYSFQEKSTAAKTNALSSIQKGGCKQRLNKVAQKVCSTGELEVLS